MKSANLRYTVAELLQYLNDNFDIPDANHTQLTWTLKVKKSHQSNLKLSKSIQDWG